MDGDGKIEFEETVNRSLGQLAIKDGLLVMTDLSGLIHCFDAATGKRHWFYDPFSAIWTPPLIAGKHIYIGTEDGDMLVFALSADREVAMPGGKPVSAMKTPSSIYAPPVAANNVLYIAAQGSLIAIEEEPPEKE